MKTTGVTNGGAATGEFTVRSLPIRQRFGARLLQRTLNFIVWLRITDEGSVPEMRILSIMLIKSYQNGVYILVEVSFHIFL